MAAFDAPMLLVVLLVSFCKETVAPGGWTEDRTPDRPQYRAMSQFVYFKQKPHLRGDEGFTFLVTQVRWKVCSPSYDRNTLPTWIHCFPERDDR
ncbi:hypothetical protein MTO96_034724 [Rhipicephalus appendiculatus]